MTAVTGADSPEATAGWDSARDDNWLRAADTRLRIPPAGWRARSACADADHGLFVGELSPAQENRAKEICERCRVRDDCLAFSIAHGVPYGVWGGLNGSERERLRQIWSEQRARISRAGL